MKSASGNGPSAKKPRGDLPDTLDPHDFVNAPSEDRQCVKCHQVPINPQLSSCCNTIYCQPCSKTKTYCVTHHCIMSYTDDKKLRSKIMDLRIRCPNWRGGCQFKEGVSKVYRQHLPECQIQAQGSAFGSGPGGRTPAGMATPLSVSHSPVTTIKLEPTSTMPTPRPPTAAGSSKTSTAGGKGVSPMFGGMSKFDDKPSKVKVKPTTQVQCRYRRIGCPWTFPSQIKMEQHLLEDMQQHLDVAIGKIEQLMDTLHHQ